MATQRVLVIPARHTRPIGPNGLRLCRGCERESRSSRHSWCSDECRIETQIRAFPSFARHHVEKRDQGVCAECGADAGLIERVVYRLRWKRSVDAKHAWAAQ